MTCNIPDFLRAVHKSCDKSKLHMYIYSIQVIGTLYIQKRVQKKLEMDSMWIVEFRLKSQFRLDANKKVYL